MLGGSGVLDYAFIRCVAQTFSCRNYLEIGTYIGESINILTDICDTCHSVTASQNSPHYMKNWCRMQNMPNFSDRLAYESNIVHHKCFDSRQFDFSKVDRNIDLYFIDGDHSYIGVYFDTVNVFKHRLPDSIVIWHDFKNRTKSSEVPLAVKNALGDEWENVFCVDTNICGIYIPLKYQKDFSLRKWQYTEEEQELYVYDTTLKVSRKQ